MPQSYESIGPRPSPWRWVVCGLLLLATTLNYMDRVALNQTSVRITKSFGLTESQYGYLESVFSLAFAVGTLSAGWLVDRGGVRWVYPLAVAGWSLAGFLTGYAESFATLLVCRLTLGIFEAANWPCGVRTVRQVMPPAERSLGNSLFQSGTAIGAIITPMIVLACLAWSEANDPDNAHSWRLPFRVIGAIGFIWVGLWLLLPGRVLTNPVEQSDAGSTSYWSIFRDHRFYVLIAVIIGVNTSWHTFRIWLPKYLVNMNGYSEREMQIFSIWYYVCADVGAWTVGLLTLLYARRGLNLHHVRLGAFAGCTALVLLSLVLPIVHNSAVLPIVVLVFGFGALGLFPTYFALSQNLSSQHQGKVTGTLGFINGFAMAGMSAMQGRYIDETGRFDRVLAVAGIPALIALVLALIYWRNEKRG